MDRHSPFADAATPNGPHRAVSNSTSRSALSMKSQNQLNQKQSSRHTALKDKSYSTRSSTSRSNKARTRAYQHRTVATLRREQSPLIRIGDSQSGASPFATSSEVSTDASSIADTFSLDTPHQRIQQHTGPAVSQTSATATAIAIKNREIAHLREALKESEAIAEECGVVIEEADAREQQLEAALRRMREENETLSTQNAVLLGRLRELEVSTKNRDSDCHDEPSKEELQEAVNELVKENEDLHRRLEEMEELL